MAAETKHAAGEITAIRRADGESRTLAASLPRLVLEARRIAANVIHGLHGRRRGGAGESFWQYRRFVSGEPSQSVDWRRSARDDHLYVREQEWEAAHTVWLWPDRSPSMAFASKQARDSKLERTLIVTFALAELLVAGGERVGIPGLINPTASRSVIDKMAQAMLHDDAARLSLPPSFVPSALAEIVVLSDFWSPISDIKTMLAGLSASGAHGTLIRAVSNLSNRKAAASSPLAAPSDGPTITSPAWRNTGTRFEARPTSSTGCSRPTPPAARPPNCCCSCIRA
jgi:uncharacterized protein (DUF58 family)